MFCDNQSLQFSIWYQDSCFQEKGALHADAHRHVCASSHFCSGYGKIVPLYICCSYGKVTSFWFPQQYWQNHIILLSFPCTARSYHPPFGHCYGKIVCLLQCDDFMALSLSTCYCTLVILLENSSGTHNGWEWWDNRMPCEAKCEEILACGERSPVLEFHGLSFGGMILCFMISSAAMNLCSTIAGPDP